MRAASTSAAVFWLGVLLGLLDPATAFASCTGHLHQCNTARTCCCSLALFRVWMLCNGGNAQRWAPMPGIVEGRSNSTHGERVEEGSHEKQWRGRRCIEGKKMAWWRLGGGANYCPNLNALPKYFIYWVDVGMTKKIQETQKGSRIFAFGGGGHGSPQKLWGGGLGKGLP